MKTIEQRAEDIKKLFPETPQAAYEAAKIAAQEQEEDDFEKAWKLFEHYATYYHPRKEIRVCTMTKAQFREAFNKTII